MRVTLDLPEAMAERLPKEPEQIASILERGLRGMWSATSNAGREVIEFLASGHRALQAIKGIGGA